MLTWTTALFHRNAFYRSIFLTIIIYNGTSYIYIYSYFLIDRIVNEDIVRDTNENYGAEYDYATLQVWHFSHNISRYELCTERLFHMRKKAFCA